MKRHMDWFMDENQRMPDLDVLNAKESFLIALDKVQAAFGEHAFRRWMPEKQTWRKQILASLFDAEMFAVDRFAVNELRQGSPNILDGLKQLFVEPDFRQSIDAATNTPALFRHRISAVTQMIQRTIG